MPIDRDQPIVVWPCYEPAGYRVALTEADLLQHVLLLGSTGSGKSTLLTSAAEQLIHRDASNVKRKAGLLILDAKADDLVLRVKAAASQAGRSGDVLLLGPAGDHAYDLFGGLKSLEAVGRITRQLLLGADKFGSDNGYWLQTSTAMISAALSLIVAGQRSATFGAVVEFMRRWFLSPLPPADLQALVKFLTESRRKGHPLVAAALDQVQVWQVLDARTRSNLQSCLLNILRPLLSSAALKCFDARSKPAGSPAQAVDEGKIILISVNALAEPELATFFFQVAKQSFFEAIQQRHGNDHRLCGLIADEFPLVVSRSDAEQVATVRSKRCFIMAASQGLHSLSERVGIGPARVLANNFNTTVYLRSREAETAVQAHLALGSRIEKKRLSPPAELGSLGLLSPPEKIPTEVPVCPMGALGQLDVHQAFIVFANGSRTESPVWFVPWFEQNPSTIETPLVDPQTKFSPAHVENLMRRQGFKPCCSPAVVLKAASISRRRRRATLRRVKTFFSSKALRVPEGLETLPEVWLRALPGILWHLRKPDWTHLPFFISRVAVAEGLLLLEFAQELSEAPDRVTAWDRIRISMNASLYPSRFRPLHRWHRLKLRQLHPGLSLSAESPGQSFG